MAGASLKAALIVNFVIGVVKSIAAFFTMSSAMFSEALHSFADTFNQILLALGINRSKKKPDLEHPFGYAKVQFFWAFVVAVLIFGISGTIAFIHGLEIILHPEVHHLEEGLFGWNIAVLLIAIVLEAFALKTAYGEAKEYQERLGSETLGEALEEMQDPVLLSLLVEDTLALAGLVIAFIGVIITEVTGLAIIDGYTSLAIGIVLGAGGLLLAKENKVYLVGRSVNTKTQEQIREIVNSFEEVDNIDNMKTMLLGPKDMILTLDIDFKKEFENTQIGAVIDKIENKLAKEFKALSPEKIFIEAQL